MSPPIPHALATAAVLLVSLATTLARTPSDLEGWEKLRIKQERSLLIETTLVTKGEAAAAIVPADGEGWKTAATNLQHGIAAQTGVTLPIVAPGIITDRDWETRHLLVLGNLLNNAVFARLYGNYFACADAAYTGGGGYELRSIHDPWGMGRNAIVLGAQDEAGVELAVKRLLVLTRERAAPGELKLGRLMELRLAAAGRRAPLDAKLSVKEIADRKQSIADIYAQPGTERSAAHQTIRFAMQYHRTGDEGWLELYRDAMRQHIHYYETNEYILKEGPRRYDRDFRDSWAYGMVIAWDLVEEAPGWTEEQRLQLTNHVLRMVWESNLYQRWDSPASVERWRKFDSITHNHHTWPGLANLFGGWYFCRHYGLAAARDWLDIALGMFRSCSRSWKPWEDSAGYQWIPLRHVLMYALATGDRTFIEQGHAARAGTALLQALDSLGRQPAWGDCGGFTSVSGMPELLCALEYATGEGCYRWAVEWLALDARDEMQAPYWTGVAPRKPEELSGVTVTYLPKVHYRLFGSTKQSSIWQKPNLPFEDTFDKLTLRSGWSDGDDYLMLDGTAAGSHGHLDGNSIVAYTSAGAQWLVDAEYIRRIPKYHSGVTVLKNGVSTLMPPSARLDEAVWFGNGALTRTTMPHYNGVTWTRNLVFLPRRYVAVIDELTAEEEGDYSLRCCWRVAGECALEAGSVRARQGNKGFTLRNLSGQEQELVAIKEFAGLPIHHVYQRQSGRLRVGETVRFVNIFAASANGPPEIEAELMSEGKALVTWGGETELLGVGGLEGSASSDASLYRISGREAWLAGATRFGPVLASPSPRAARIDGRGLAFAVPGKVPEEGLRPVSRIGEAQPLTERLDLAKVVTEFSHAKPVSAAGHAASLVDGGAMPIIWRFAGVPVAPHALRVAGIRSSLPPREPYSPLERLIDGASNGSTTSCMFPAGKSVAVTLDLGEPRRLRGVRVKAWEMHEGWKTEALVLSLSGDDFDKDAREAGVMPETGTQRFGGNVNTIREVNLDAVARYVRVAGEPVDRKAAVYLAEIEVLGERPGEKPKLVAMAPVDLNGDGRTDVVLGTAGGDILALSGQGREMWRWKADGPITALAAGLLEKDGQAVVVYGTGSATLGLLTADGGAAGQVKPPAYRGVPSCVRTISLADLDGDGAREIVIGCDSWQYMAYSDGLELMWKTVYYAHGATAGHVADLNGDGQPEIVAGNAYYCLQILDHRGRVIRRGSESFGPEQSAVTSMAAGRDGKRAVVVGTDGGAVLAFDCEGRRLWEANAGDRVTSLCMDTEGGAPRIVVASESGYVWALDSGGKAVWKRDLGAPVKRLVGDGLGYVAAAWDNGVVRLSKDGRVEGVAAASAAVSDVAALGGGRVVALTEEGEVMAVETGGNTGELR